MNRHKLQKLYRANFWWYGSHSFCGWTLMEVIKDRSGKLTEICVEDLLPSTWILV